MIVGRSRVRRASVALLILVALLLRLNNLAFGLPSLYDPDEPIFVVLAAKLLSNHTLNPEWFGHPATTTIYTVAVVQILVYAAAFLSGKVSSVSDLIHAAYADPTLLFLPARIVMALLGAGGVGLTYLVARRAQGTAAGMIAALLLALNAIHIEWSQVIRSDVQASFFMLLSLLLAIRFASDGRIRDLAFASLFAGFAVATKWPAVTIAVSLVGAPAYRFAAGKLRATQTVAFIALAGFITIAGVFIASPYIFLDYQTVLANVSGEARPFHLGHTGGSPAQNFLSYVRHEIASSMGWIGAALVVVGVAVVATQKGPMRFTLLPAAAAFMLLLCTQKLVFSRWFVPEIPFLCIFAAVGTIALSELVSRRWAHSRKYAVLGAAAAFLLWPTAVGAIRQAKERANDTRSLAAAWLVANIPAGKTIALEHLELSLRNRPYRFLFPMGSAGCLDAKTLLQRGVRYEELEQLRNGSPQITLGSVAPREADTCRADFAVLSYYDIYVRDHVYFPRELATYAAILRGGRTIALFEPKSGQIGGPVVRIVAMPRTTKRHSRP